VSLASDKNPDPGAPRPVLRPHPSEPRRALSRVLITRLDSGRFGALAEFKIHFLIGSGLGGFRLTYAPEAGPTEIEGVRTPGPA
jgi:hypothetical protein